MGADARDAACLNAWHADGACFATGAMPGVGWLAAAGPLAGSPPWAGAAPARTASAACRLDAGVPLALQRGRPRVRLALGWAEDVNGAGAGARAAPTEKRRPRRPAAPR